MDAAVNDGRFKPLVAALLYFQDQKARFPSVIRVDVPATVSIT
jgi:hypothetical protein